MSDNKARVLDHELAVDHNLWLDDDGAGSPDLAAPMVANQGTVVGGGDPIWYMVGHNVDGDVHTKFNITALRSAGAGDGALAFYDFNDQKIGGQNKVVTGFDTDGFWSVTVEAPVKFIRCSAAAATTIEYKVTSFDTGLPSEWQMTRTVP